MRIGIGTDHGGFALKQELLIRLKQTTHESPTSARTNFKTTAIMPSYQSRSPAPLRRARWSGEFSYAASASARRSAPTKSPALVLS